MFRLDIHFWAVAIRIENHFSQAKVKHKIGEPYLNGRHQE